MSSTSNTLLNFFSFSFLSLSTSNQNHQANFRLFHQSAAINNIWSEKKLLNHRYYQYLYISNVQYLDIFFSHSFKNFFWFLIPFSLLLFFVNFLRLLILSLITLFCFNQTKSHCHKYDMYIISSHIWNKDKHTHSQSYFIFIFIFTHTLWEMDLKAAAAAYLFII